MDSEFTLHLIISKLHVIACIFLRGHRVAPSSRGQDAGRKASHIGFPGLWAPKSAGASPLTIAQMVLIHNAAVEQRELYPGKALFKTRKDLLPLLPLLEAYARQYLHRVYLCEQLRREVPVDKGADVLPPMFWTRRVHVRERRQRSRIGGARPTTPPRIVGNGREEYIEDDFVVSARLLPEFQEQEDGEKFTFAYQLRRAWDAHLLGVDRRLPKYSRAEELAQLCYLLILEVKFLSGCDLQWKSAPKSVEPAGNTAQPTSSRTGGSRGPGDGAGAGPVRAAPSYAPSSGSETGVSDEVLEQMEKDAETTSNGR